MADFDLDHIVHEPRAVSAGYHFMMARAWRIIGEEKHLHTPLAYAAFEFRCSIERTLIELLVLIKEQKPSKADFRSMNSITNTVKSINNSVGGATQFRRAATFNRVFSQLGGVPRAFWLSTPDPDRLLRYWSKLSEYCHRQLKPNETWDSLGKRWLRNGYALVNEVEQYLWEITIESHIGWVAASKQQPETQDAYNDFLGGRISEKALVTRLQLMSPVLEERMRRRGGGPR
jgi:hypothetical protein